MEKVLLSILAGIIVAGSASAVPSVDARKKACEQQPDKVWVEKTKACIPANSCSQDNYEIRNVYCSSIQVPREKTELVVGKYIEKVLHTSMIESTARPLYSPDGVGVETADGGYMAFEYDFFKTPMSVSRASEIAFEAFGTYHVGSAQDFTTDYRYEGYVCGKTESKSLCQEVTDFASKLIDKPLDMEYYDNDNLRDFQTDCCIVIEKVEYEKFD